MLHQMRWRKAPRDHRRLWVALTIALLLHAFFVAVLWYEMEPGLRPYSPPQVVQVQLDSAIQVRFITRSASAAHAAAPPPIAPPPPPPRPSREPLAKNAMTLHMPGPAPVPATTPPPQPAPATSVAPQLFDRTGRIILPANASSAPAAPAADYVQRGPQGDTQIMHDHDPVKYKPTGLDRYWRKSTNAVDDALQKLVDKTTVTKTIQLPKGIRIHCGISIAALSGGCGGDPPPPPPSNDGDERLNMAPTALIKNAATPAKPDVATCIAIYKSGKPLPYGCPVDTPARAASVQKPPSPQGP
ncbi:hypothetical protein ACFFJT_04745 [Dyella flava]|uniref:Uncharacterized protein n=1 Tax=Dyella flava TaxID=1920170 RepID=A0ABS2K6Y6_9GAMM|nr:hypothetical protein [Dyella flava]MBM7126664.1 hypothetical protein [Dyella flava]GLQ49515.1 hypothetical protein GCM10010872_09640 [Dyella flava]